MSNFVFKGTTAFFVLAIVLSMVMVAEGGVGGGGSEARTPYYVKQEVKEDEVIQIKTKAGMNRRVEDLEFTGGKRVSYGEHIGLMFVKDYNDHMKPSFEFKGITESGDEVAIDFSEVESFTLIKVEDNWFSKDRALLAIDIFPYISPKELLNLKPGYSELKEKYTKIISLWITLEDKEKGELYLVGKEYSDECKLFGRLRDIKQNLKFVLDYGPPGADEPIWWAIPSVINDPNYPYKQHLGRR